ncbi:DinB family protein [Streptomyces sp. NPDC001985]|uniref:DinB family protein n=1 Tax=Streptomyces sp. NPDC001985 TaxID=3154406 RepID=UPI003333B54C
MPEMPDGRPVPPLCADERHMLETWLDFHRETLALKCAGLGDEQMRTVAVEPSEMTLLGLVQHMEEVERNWFQIVLAQRDVPPVRAGGGHLLDPARSAGDALAGWRAEVARSRKESAAAVSLDVCGLLPDEPLTRQLFGGREVSLRWILIHMIEEYARHNGHADLLRERIDGVTGT